MPFQLVPYHSKRFPPQAILASILEPKPDILPSIHSNSIRQPEITQPLGLVSGFKAGHLRDMYSCVLTCAHHMYQFGSSIQGPTHTSNPMQSRSLSRYWGWLMCMTRSNQGLDICWNFGALELEVLKQCSALSIWDREWLEFGGAWFWDILGWGGSAGFWEIGRDLVVCLT